MRRKIWGAVIIGALSMFISVGVRAEELILEGDEGHAEETIVTEEYNSGLVADELVLGEDGNQYYYKNGVLQEDYFGFLPIGEDW